MCSKDCVKAKETRESDVFKKRRKVNFCLQATFAIAAIPDHLGRKERVAVMAEDSDRVWYAVGKDPHVRARTRE